MNRKTIAVNMSAVIGYERLKGLFAELAAGKKVPVRFLADMEKGQLLSLYSYPPIIARVGDGWLVRPHECRGVAVDAHYHPHGDLRMSPIDEKTMKENNLPLVIIYGDKGQFAFYRNSAFDPLLPVSGKLLHYGYCNIKRIIGENIGEIIGRNNQKINSILSKLQQEIDQIEQVMRDFCSEETKDDNGFIAKLRRFVNANYPGYKGDLRIDDHEISHAIEDFLRRNIPPARYKQEAEVLAGDIFARITGKDYEVIAELDQAFAEELLAEIRKNLQSGGGQAFLGALGDKMIDVRQKTEKMNKIEEEKDGNQPGIKAPEGAGLNKDVWERAFGSQKIIGDNDAT